MLVRIYGIAPLLSHNHGILAIEQQKYRGMELELSDGTRIRSGAALLLLHLRSAWFTQHNGQDAFKVMLEGLRCVQTELKILAGRMGQGEFAQIEVLMCTTFFYALFARLGFELRDPPHNLHTLLSAFYISRLRESYYPQGRKGMVQPGIIREIKQGWMSRDKFIKTYGQGK